MKLFRIPIFFLAILLPCAAHALRPDAAISQYPHDRWGQSGGLVSETIYSGVQTDDGYLWFATSGGLARFNGRDFKVLNSSNTPELKENRITALLRDRDNSLWIGTSGAGLLNYKDGKFKTFTVDDGLSDNSIISLARDGHGNLWILTRLDLNKFAGGKISTVPIDHVRSIFADQQGALIGTEDGFSICTNEKIAHYAGPEITAIYRNSKNEIWLGVKNQGLARWENSKIVPVLHTGEILSLLEDRDHILWIGTRHGLQNLLRDSPLHPNIHSAVTSLMEDREGSLWITTGGEGIHRFRPSAFITYGFRQGLENVRTSCLIQDHDSAIWIGTEEGLTRWKDARFTTYALPSPVRTIAIDPNQTMWVGTRSGIFRWDGNAFSSIIPKVSATSIVADPDGTLWIGGEEGLKKFSDGKLTQIAEEEITDLCLDLRGNLLAGTRNGLREWKEESLQPSLINAPILCIQQDRNGDVWVGSSEGVHRIHNGKMNDYAKAELYDVVALSILPDDAGNLWMSTREGIVRAHIEKGKMEFLRFTSTSGLSAMECSDGKPGSWKSADGNLWFATVNGISTVNPNHFFRNQIPPPVLIEQMDVDRVPIRDLKTKNLTLPAGTSRIEFRYAGLSYLPSVQFRYVLKGFDHFWINAGAQTRAEYTNLPPGKYVFKVLASNNNQLWNIAGAALPFEIEGEGFSSGHFSNWIPFGAALIGFIAGWFVKTRFKREQPQRRKDSEKL